MTTNQTLTTATMPKLAINVRLDGAYELQNEATQCPVATMAFYPDERHERHAELMMRAVNSHAELLIALSCAAELAKVARQYFPKSMRNLDKFQLENYCATINTAIAKAKGQL